MSHSGELAVPSRQDDLKALFYALGLEVVLLVVLWVAHMLGFLQEEPPVREVAVLQLTEAPTPPAPLEPPAPPPPKVQPVVHHEKVMPVVPQPQQPEVQPTPVVPTEPTPFSEKKVQTPPTPPAPSVQSSQKVDELTEYAARVRSAVQSALQYPEAAREMQFVGRTRVEFTLTDGHPGQARIVASSGVNMLDRAAVRAVSNADYPAPPTTLQSKTKVFQIWVEFNLGQ